MDVRQVEAKITGKTKAILPVHLYGQMADMAPLLELGRKYGIPVIEDAAQSHGATCHGHSAGSMGLCGCFSL
jgi:dTDP-4-amino-4,6-dideoxygalactose transaminase